MFFEQKYRIQVRDTGKSTKITNKGFLGLMEDVASLHSSKVGFGFYDIPKTNLTWLLLGWNLKVITRPQVEDMVYVKTWSRKIEKYYAYREFEVHDEQGNLLAVANSKWIMIDTKNRKVKRVEDESEPDYQAYKDENMDKLKIPDDYDSSIEYKLARRDIDIYNHMHNLYYLDLAYEALPEEIYNYENEFNNIRISYKREIKSGKEIKCMYKKLDDKHVVVIRSKDGNTLHSIIEMW